LVVDTELLLHGITCLVQKVVDGAAVLASELLRHLGQLSHALLPVVELLDGAVVLVVATLLVGILNIGIDFVLPFAENGCVVKDEVDFLGGALTETCAHLVAQGVEHDVALEGLLSLDKLLSELVKGLFELLLLVNLAHFPLLGVHLVQHGLVDVVDEGLKHAHGVLRDLTEKDLLVAGTLGVNGGACLRVTKEVHSFTTEFLVAS